MKLVGTYMSPFTRRVGISASILGLAYEHVPLSTARDQEKIRKYHPMARVPALVLDDGETLVESGAILDWLDEQVAPAERLVPPSGRDRRDVLRLAAWATGAGDKTVAAFYELSRRPEDKIHPPAVAGNLAQARTAFGVLDEAASGGGWLVGGRLTQADVSAVAFYEFARVVVGDRLADGSWPGLDALRDRAYGAAPAFAETAPK